MESPSSVKVTSEASLFTFECHFSLTVAGGLLFFHSPRTLGYTSLWVLLSAGQYSVMGRGTQKLVLLLWSKPGRIWFQVSLDTAGPTFYPWTTSFLCITDTWAQGRFGFIWSCRKIFEGVRRCKNWIYRKNCNVNDWGLLCCWQLLWNVRAVRTFQQVGGGILAWLKELLFWIRCSCEWGLSCNLKSTQ